MSAQTATRPFRYKAVDRDGNLEAGEMLATSLQHAEDRLRRTGFKPVAIAPLRSNPMSRELRVPGFGPKIKGEELAILARQFATMIGAGIALTRCLAVLHEQSENPLLETTLAEIRTAVESGESLSSALERHPAVFDHLFVSMVKAGERAGALDTVLMQLAAALERSVAIRRKIRSAMAYPIAILLMVSVIITVMLLFVVPVFSDIYADLGGTLPLPTRVLVAASELLTARLPFVVVGIGLLVSLIRRWRSTARGRLVWDSAKLRLPLIGPLHHKTAMARVGRTLAVLTRSGVTVIDAMKIAAETTGNAVVTAALLETMEGVGRGERLASNLERHDVFPAMVIQLVSVGEETGSLDEMFEIVGSTFEGEVESAVAGLAALIEPLLMAFIGIVVGAMVISLYLPMFRIIDLVQ